MKPLCHLLAAFAFVFCTMAADLHQELETISRQIGGRVGVSAVLLESGEHVGLHAGEPFFMASVVKFPVALRVLQLVDEGKLRLDQKVAVQNGDVTPDSTVLDKKTRPGAEFAITDLLKYMVSSSDNTSCDMLMRISGGPQATMARMQALGIQGVRVDRNERTMDLDWTRSSKRFLKDVRDTSTPDAMTALLAKFQAGEALKPTTSALLREMMENAAAAMSGRLKGLLPRGTVVAHKTGTWGVAATNDVGIITLPGGSKHIAIAVFTNQSKKDPATIEHVIAQISRAIYDHWDAAQ